MNTIIIISLEKSLIENLKFPELHHIYLLNNPFAMEWMRTSTRSERDYTKLLEAIPISPRQLQREFKSVYGMTIRDYLRLLRISEINNYMMAGKDVNFTQLSYDFDFSDQSHLIKEFKLYSGITPKKLLKNRHDFIINTGH